MLDGLISTPFDPVRVEWSFEATSRTGPVSTNGTQLRRDRSFESCCRIGFESGGVKSETGRRSTVSKGKRA